tara:strand:+ start:30363 stop:31289 length:927 start_codon:yes stop_codon:yes gene_type:complete
MSITVLQSGVQMTLQGAQRIGSRHLGVPASGPADPLSMALANRLVGNSSDATAFEITFGGAGLGFNTPVSFALSGSPAFLTLNDKPIKSHTTYTAYEGDELQIAPSAQGCRIYLACAAVLEATRFLGSTSTYIPAALGGHEGRALKANDRISMSQVRLVPTQSTPEDLQLVYSNSYALRAVEGPDFSLGSSGVWNEIYTVSQRASRMGIELTGPFPQTEPGATRSSSAICPGALQLPPGGRGFLLLADAQTTGGYPHLLQICRADRHLIGQIRPGDRVRFLHRTQDQASDALRAKQALLSTWLPDFAL